MTRRPAYAVSAVRGVYTGVTSHGTRGSKSFKVNSRIQVAVSEPSDTSGKDPDVSSHVDDAVERTPRAAARLERGDSINILYENNAEDSDIRSLGANPELSAATQMERHALPGLTTRACRCRLPGIFHHPAVANQVLEVAKTNLLQRTANLSG